EGMAMPLSEPHHVSGRPLRGDFPGMERVHFGMGCFWGAERLFWREPGVHVTAAGYAGGSTADPTYREACSGRTGHAEVVLEGHDPTQGMRQGNDIGSQYRSVVHCTTAGQHAAALASRAAYQQRLDASGHGQVTTEIVFPAPPFFHAEQTHQQYLSRNPGGYC